MPEQFQEKFQFEGQLPLYSDKSLYGGYESASRNNYTFAYPEEKLRVRKSFQLWRCLLLLLASFTLWGGILFSIVLAWDYTLSHDMGYTRFLLVFVAITVTIYFVGVNIMFGKNSLKRTT